MRHFKNLLFIVILLSIILSCSGDDKTNPAEEPAPGSLQIEFSNIIESEALMLNTGTYVNQSNESYTVKELKYIISNLVLIKENGEEFVYPVAESYFVINEENEASKKITLSNIPEGSYTKIRFGIGVDQSKYPIESGTANFIPTAEENGMLWNWSAGYKFIKFEGSFTVESETDDYIFHVGSHGDNLDNYKEAIVDSKETILIRKDMTTSTIITADIAKIFDSVHQHSLQEKSDIQVDPVNAPKIAENVQTMFSSTTTN